MSEKYISPPRKKFRSWKNSRTSCLVGEDWFGKSPCSAESRVFTPIRSSSLSHFTVRPGISSSPLIRSSVAKEAKCCVRQMNVSMLAF